MLKQNKSRQMNYILQAPVLVFSQVGLFSLKSYQVGTIQPLCACIVTLIDVSR